MEYQINNENLICFSFTTEAGEEIYVETPQVEGESIEETIQRVGRKEYLDPLSLVE